MFIDYVEKCRIQEMIIMTRKLAFVGFSYLTGLFIGSIFVLSLSLAAGGAFFASGICAMLFFRKKKSVRVTRCAVCAISLSVGILHYSFYDIFVCLPAEKYDGTDYYGRCTVISAEYYSSGGGQYILDCELPDGSKTKAALYSFSESDLVRGDIVTLKGTLILPESGGFFDSREYLSGMGVHLMIDGAEITAIDIKENNIFEKIRRLRERIISQLRRIIGGEAGELVIGMLFGNSFWNISESSENMLYRAGIGHAAAVSGMHMSIAAGIAAAIVNALGGTKRERFAAVLLFSMVFAFFADLKVSVMRGMIMIVIVYAAQLFRRESDPVTSLAAAVILITLPAPYCVKSTSFLLSVSGVLGSAVFAPCIIRSIEKHITRKRQDGERYHAGFLLTSAVTVLSAAAAVFPASAAAFDEISVISPLSNLILSPLCTASVTAAIVGASASLVPGISVIAPLFYRAAGLVCELIISAASFLGGLPFAAVPADLDILPPLAVLTAAAAAVCAAVTGSRTHTLLTFAASVFICMTSVAVYWSVPSSCTEITVLTEGKGCVIIESDGSISKIYDFMGTKKGAEAARRYIARTGAGQPSAVILTKNTENAALIYKEKFPGVSVTAAPENTVTIGESRFIGQKGYSVIETDGARMICVSSRSEIPDEMYSLAVLSCISPVDVKAELYAVARRDYGGSVPAAAPCVKFTSSTYIVSGGKLYPKEEYKWLR